MEIIILLTIAVITIILILFFLRYWLNLNKNSGIIVLRTPAGNGNGNRNVPACKPPRNPNHCPQGCSPFLYPDMYSPQASCSDPFNWGDWYTTGRCPKRVARNIENFDDTVNYMVDGVEPSDLPFPDPKWENSDNYGFNYDF